MAQREYTKPPLSIEEQIKNIKSKGFQFHDEENAKLVLKFNNYYRLSGYWKSFENKMNDPIFFEDIYNLYTNDRILRILLLEMIEKFEISAKTLIAYELSMIFKSVPKETIKNKEKNSKESLPNNDAPFKYLDSNLYKIKENFYGNIGNLCRELAPSHLKFIEHYKANYHDNSIYNEINHFLRVKNSELKRIESQLKYLKDPKKRVELNLSKEKILSDLSTNVSFNKLKKCFPPIWISCEIMSLGSISKVFSSLNVDIKKKINVHKAFDLNLDVFESFLRQITIIRNFCAHHSRFWNVNLPYKLMKERKLTDYCNKINTNEEFKLYDSLVHMIYIYNQLDKKESVIWKDKLFNFFANNQDYCNNLGFIHDWKKKEIWK